MTKVDFLRRVASREGLFRDVFPVVLSAGIRRTLAVTQRGRNDFLTEMSKKHGVPIQLLRDVYSDGLRHLQDSVLDDDSLDLCHDLIESDSVARQIVSLAYEEIVSQIIEVMSEGRQLMLTGFGVFYAHRHSGHKVNFVEASASITDYVTFRFSGAKVVNKALTRDLGDDAAHVVVDDE